MAAIWKAAIDEYEEITGIQFETLAAVNHIDGILVQVGLNEANFKLHRHNGSKSDKFRTLVQKSLTPIEKLSNIVAQATKTVSNHKSPKPLMFAPVNNLPK